MSKKKIYFSNRKFNCTTKRKCQNRSTDYVTSNRLHSSLRHRLRSREKTTFPTFPSLSQCLFMFENCYTKRRLIGQCPTKVLKHVRLIVKICCISMVFPSFSPFLCRPETIFRFLTTVIKGGD